MTKYWAAFASVLLLLATPAVAAGSWADSYKTCDADNSGSISRAEWTSCEAKLDPQMNPTFTVMDQDGNNSVDEDEWAAAEGIKTAIGNNCQKSDSSWCPCQNHPEKPECQKKQ